MRKLRILISAAEVSSDAHGAELLKSLREILPEGTVLEAFGIGGPKLRAAGLDPVVDARNLLAMGFLEIVAHLPRIFSALRRVSSEARLRKPDVAVVLDYPDFHFRLARKLAALGIPLIYYIPPKVWAWRTGRVKTLRALFAKVLCILPFETAFYSGHGVPVQYVGNPLCDELPWELGKEEARRKLGIPLGRKALLIMAGSRASELKRQLGVLLDAAQLASECMARESLLNPGEKLSVLLPLSGASDPVPVNERVQEWRMGNSGAPLLEIRVSQGDAHEAMVACDAGLIKSGTSTLEAGLLGCVHCVLYRTNALTELIFRQLIRYRGPIGLVNLVAGAQGVDGPAMRKPYLIHEYVGREATVPALAREVVSLLGDPGRRAEIQAGLAQLREKILAQKESPSRVAAREVLKLCGVDLP